MKIQITAGDWGGEYEATSGKEAIKAFFRDIIAGKIKFAQLSPLGLWTDGKMEEPIPFRIAPAMCRAGLLSPEGLVATFRAVELDFEPDQIMAMIRADTWMVE